jgi:hypothetical protein
LAALEEDEFIVLSVKNSSQFIQFAAQGSFGMRAESVSDFYLPEQAHLSDRQVAKLLELGWNAPTNLPDELELGGQKKPDGSPNYYLDVASPVPHDILAALAAATLVSVFGVGHPGELEYTAVSRDGGSVRFPNLGLRRRKK